jgi:copper chaperone CopZ
MNSPVPTSGETPAQALEREGFKKIDGILEADLCPVSRQIHILYDPDKVSDEEIARHARRMEPYLKQHFDRCLFKLGGRACEACAIRLEKRAEAIHGVRRANASFFGGAMSIQFDQAQIEETELLQKLLNQGAKVSPWEMSAPPRDRKGPARSEGGPSGVDIHGKFSWRVSRRRLVRCAIGLGLVEGENRRY